MPSTPGERPLPLSALTPRKRSLPAEKETATPRPHFTHTHLFGATPSKRPKFVEKSASPVKAAERKPIAQSKSSKVLKEAFGKPLPQPKDLEEESIGLPDGLSEKHRQQCFPRKSVRTKKNHLLKKPIPTVKKVLKNTPSDEPKESSQGPGLPEPPSPISQLMASQEPSEIIPPTQSQFSELSPLMPLELEFEPSPISDSSPNPSRDRLIGFLNKRLGLTAMTLKQLLVTLHLSPSVGKYAKTMTCEIENYVCAGKDELFSSLKKPFKLPAALRSEHGSNEEFLNNVWKLLRSRPAVSSFNSEIHTGPWHELISQVGKERVAYILLNFRIYRPFRYERGTWLQLTGSDRLNEPELKFGSRNLFAKNEICLTKADIMYRFASGKKPFSITGLAPNDQFKFHPKLLPLLEKVYTRVAQYNKLDCAGGIRVPGPISETRKWSSRAAVAKFLCHRLDKLLPISILGSKSNKVNFYKSVLYWLKAPGFKRISLNRMTKGMKLSEIPWLKESVDGRPPKYHLDMCVEWVCETLLKPLILHHFYLTELSGKSGSLYYFSHETWRKSMFGPASEALLQRLDDSSQPGSAAPDSRKESGTACEETRAPRAVQQWRVTPKMDGSTRIILNLKNFNESLKTAHLILRHVSSANSTRLDSWHDWMIRLYDYRDKITKSGQEHPKFHLVKLDISGCYDNANVAKVKEIASESLNVGRDLYRVVDLKRLNLTTGKLGYQRRAFKIPEPSVRIAEQLSSSDASSIILESGNSTLVQGDRALSDVNRVFNEIQIQIHSRVLNFSSGIPQGSACSLDLCNIMLDDLVKKRLGKFANDPQSLLLRYVDDFLFVSTNEDLVLEFQQAMRNDFELEYGVSCKPAKITSTCGSGNRLKKLNFLGHDIDIRTLDVHPRAVPRRVEISSHFSPDVLKRSLSYDLECLLGVARAFKRANKPLPARLMHETSIRFGAALAGGRLNGFVELENRKGPANKDRVRRKVVHRNLLSLIDKQSRSFARRLVMLSYNRQTKAVIKKRGSC